MHVEGAGDEGKGATKKMRKRGGPMMPSPACNSVLVQVRTVCFHKNTPLANMQDQNTSQACTVVLTVMHNQFEITAFYTSHVHMMICLPL